jgi:predicted transcriptional regulator
MIKKIKDNEEKIGITEEKIKKLMNILKTLNSTQAKKWGINYNTLKNIKKGKIPQRSFLERWIKRLRIK